MARGVPVFLLLISWFASSVNGVAVLPRSNATQAITNITDLSGPPDPITLQYNDWGMDFSDYKVDSSLQLSGAQAAAFVQQTCRDLITKLQRDRALVLDVYPERLFRNRVDTADGAYTVFFTFRVEEKLTRWVDIYSTLVLIDEWQKQWTTTVPGFSFAMALKVDGIYEDRGSGGVSIVRQSSAPSDQGAVE